MICKNGHQRILRKMNRSDSNHSLNFGGAKLETSLTVLSRSAMMYKKAAIPTTLLSIPSLSMQVILSPAVW